MTSKAMAFIRSGRFSVTWATWARGRSTMMNDTPQQYAPEFADARNVKGISFGE